MVLLSGAPPAVGGFMNPMLGTHLGDARGSRKRGAVQGCGGGMRDAAHSTEMRRGAEPQPSLRRALESSSPTLLQLFETKPRFASRALGGGMASGEGAGRPGGLRQRQRHVAEYIFSHQRNAPDIARRHFTDTTHSLHWLWVCVWVRDAARLLRCKKVCFARLVA